MSQFGLAEALLISLSDSFEVFGKGQTNFRKQNVSKGSDLLRTPGIVKGNKSLRIESFGLV